MQARFGLSAVAAILLSLAASHAAAQAERNGKPAVAVVPNIEDLSDVGDAVFSPNGHLVAVSDGPYRTSRVMLWDVASGRPLRTLRYHALFVATSFAADGRSIVSGHKDGAIRLWNAETGAATAILDGKDEEGAGIRALWLDAKSEFLVSADEEGFVAVFDLAQRRELNRVQLPASDRLGNRPAVVAARLTADRGKLIVLTRDYIEGGPVSSIYVFDLPAGTAHEPVRLPKDYVFADRGIVGDDAFILRIARPGCNLDRLVFFELREPANFIDVYTPPTCEKPTGEGDTDAPRVFPDAGGAQVIIARDGDPELRVGDVRMRREARTIRWPGGAAVKGVIGVTPDFRLAAAHDADKVRIRTVETGEPVSELAAYGYAAENAMTLAGGRYIALSHPRAGAESKAKDLVLWKVDAPRPTVRVSAGGDVRIHDVSLDAALALAGNDNGEIFLFSTATGAEQRKFSVAGLKEISKARLAPNGKTALVLGEVAEQQEDFVTDNAVAMRVGDGKILHAFARRESGNPTALAFSPDGKRFVVGRRNGTAEMWSTDDVRRIKLLPPYAEDGDTWSLAFSPDGRLLLGGSLFDETVFIWNLASGRLVRTFELGESLVHYRHAAVLALSHDGKLLAAGLSQRAVSSGDIGVERGAIKVWDAATGKLRFTLRGHDGAVYALAFSPDDRWLISGSLDGTIRYWDRSDGKWLASFSATADGRWVIVTAAGFFAGSPDSDALVSVVRGFQSVSGTQLRERLYRPDLVEQLLKGDPEHRYRDAARRLDLDNAFESLM